MQKIIDAIVDARVLVDAYLIARGKRSADIDYERRNTSWRVLVRSLRAELDKLANGNAEIRDALLRDGLAIIGKSVATKEPSTRISAKPRLTDKQQKALDFIRNSKGDARAYNVAKHVKIKERTFLKHYVPILRHYGVKNRRDGDGYYIED
jgi:hypothetical protein